MYRPLLAFAAFSAIVSECLSQDLPRTSPTTGLTLQSIENVALWRTQILVHTADVSNAGTGAKVWARLNEEAFFLDRGGNDRQRNEWNTYDILVNDVSFVRDIRKLEIGNASTDAWTFDHVSLIINRKSPEGVSASDSTIFTWRGALVKISGDQQPAYVVATQAQLRASPLWNLNSPRNLVGSPYSILPSSILAAMIEGATGHEIGPTGISGGYKWGNKEGGGYVAIKTRSGYPPNRARIILQLETPSILPVLPANQIDLDFNLFLDKEGSPATLKVVMNKDNGSSTRFMAALSGRLKNRLKNLVPAGSALAPWFDSAHGMNLNIH